MDFKKKIIDSIAPSGLQNDKRSASSWSRKAAALSLVFSLSSLALFAACSNASSSDESSDQVPEPAEGEEDFFFTEEELAEMGVSIFESADKLGGCDSTNEFETVYVKADSGFYMCYKGKWENDFDNIDFEIEIDTLQSATELGECSAENEGEMHAIPHDSVATIYDTYACESGEWISDFGGSDGTVDPSTVVKGSFTDKRDGTTYQTVKIGNQTWMAENLRYKASGSTCYDKKSENCKKYGRLYSFASAYDACPSGWKLPTGPQWMKLLNVNDIAFNLPSHNGISNIKEDPYGLNILPAGAGYNFAKSFTGIGVSTTFWTLSYCLYNKDDDGKTLYAFYSIILNPNSNIIRAMALARGTGFFFSVRCIKK